MQHKVAKNGNSQVMFKYLKRGFNLQPLANVIGYIPSVIGNNRSFLFSPPGLQLCLQQKLVDVISKRDTRKHIIYS